MINVKLSGLLIMNYKFYYITLDLDRKLVRNSLTLDGITPDPFRERVSLGNSTFSGNVR